jgi:hypothetical protein
LVYIFIDTNSATGYQKDLPIEADYLIEVKGRHNRVISSIFYEWQGAYSWEWNWVERSAVDVGLDSIEMEVGVGWQELGLNPQNGSFDAYFMTTDWQKSISDYSNGEGVIRGPRGTRAEGLVEMTSGISSIINDRFGWNVSYAGDVNGDGYPDIIVGAPYTTGYGPNDIVTANTIANTVTILNGTSDNIWEAEGTLGPVDYARSIYVGDANNDGYNDIITADEDDNALSVYNGTSTGVWDPRCVLSVGTDPYSVFIGDANNDGYNDILAADYGSDTVSIFNGTASGFWEARGTLGVGDMPYSVHVGDANNDGLNDIVTCDFNDDTVSIYNGTSSNIWEAKYTLNVGNGPYYVYVGDANNDGYNDILTADGNDDTITIYNGTSSGDWEAKGTLSVGTLPICVVVADANNDGLNDIVSTDYNNNKVSIYKGKSDGTWESRTTMLTGNFPRSVYVGDANNDGLNDIVTSDYGLHEVSIFNGTSSGGWESRGRLGVGSGPFSVFVADANNDGFGPKAGVAYIFFGYPGIDLNNINVANANVTINGSNIGDYFGWDVSDAGNVNGDAYDDIIIGAPGYGNDKGRAYIFYGRATASWNGIDDADTDCDVNMTGESEGDKFGHSVSGAGNFDNSSNNDTIVGAPNAGGWWDSNWNFRKKLTFDNSAQSENLDYFPVLVNLSSSNFVYSKAKTDGTDLRFIDADGTTELDYHIEDWDSSGYSYVWVEVSQIDGSSSSDYIWMYYNNSAATYAQDIEGTWDSNFTAVWHLNETSSTHYDATSNDNDGSPQGGVTQGPNGIIDGADDFDGDADYIVVSTSTSLNITTQITIEAWVKPDGIDHTDVDLTVVGKFPNSDRAYQLGFNDDAGDGDDWDFRLSSDGSTSDGQVHVSNVVDNNQWQYMVGTWDGSDVRFYKNAVEIGTSVSFSGPIHLSDADVWIGDGTYYGSMDGWLDEIRISNKGRSEDWISAQYLSMTYDFVSFSSEETPSDAEGYGKAYIFYGDGSIPITAANADKNYTGENIGDQFGFAVSDAGDVDNNGNDDVIIGAPFNDDIATDAGKVYIYFYGDNYAYVSSNVTTYGVITDFNDAKSALDSGAYATLYEEDGGGTGGYEYLYVDGYDGTRDDWTQAGSSPYLDAVDDTNRIYTNSANNKHGEFTFDDTTLSGTFSSSYIELYSKQAGSGEYIEVEIDNGTGLTLVGSVTPDSTYSWKTIDVSSYLETRTMVDGAKMRVTYEKSGAGGVVDLDCARINYSATGYNLYKMDIEFNTSSVSSGSSYELQLNYSVDGSETDFGVLVYDGSSWDDLSSQGDLDSTSFETKTYNLESEHILGSGYVRVRYIGRNETSDTANSTLNIEYHRIKSSDLYIAFTGENSGDTFGWSVSNVSDINQDGTYDDVIVGAPYGGDAWWNSNWQYRKKLTFNNGVQNENLLNFPVLVNLSASNFNYSKAKPDGTDLRFIDPDSSTEYNYHIERWNSSAYSYAWVNVTQIDGGSATDYMWMYYGNSAAANVLDSEGTYDINYTGIWHLNESSGTPYDATSYDNDGTLYNAVTQNVSGRIDGAIDISGTSDPEDYIDCGNDASLYFDANKNYTYSAWFYRHANADWDVIFSKFSWSNYGFRVFVSGGGNLRVGNHTNIWVETGAIISLNTWYNLVMVYNSSSPTVPEVYVNGNKETTSGSATFLSDTASPFDIGFGWGTENYDGLIDEVRASNKIRSADWISAQYKSMTNTFITFRDEQQDSPGKVYIFHGGSSMDSTSDVNLTGESNGDRFGYSVDFAGDVDGDGKIDAIVGAPYYDNGSYTNSGNAYVFKGGSSMDFLACYEFKGSQANEHMGWSVSFALDINNSNDIAVVAGSPHRDSISDSDCGKAYVLYIRIPQIVINEIQYNPTGGPFDEDWGYKKKITINSSKVSSDLTDFPVLISITDSDLSSRAQSDGDDILFVASDNETKLDHEIERYTSGTGELIAWVRIPYLSSTTDTEIYMYYDNSNALNQENEEGVWSNGYVGVYHMVESTGNIVNSASDTNDGTREDTPTQGTGQIGYGQDFTGSTGDDRFILGDLGLTDGVQENLTLSFWVNTDDASLDDWGRVILKRDETDTNTLWGAYFDNDGSDKDLMFNTAGDTGANTIGKSVWVYVSFTYDGSIKYHYHNGSQVRTDSGGSGPISATTSTAPVTIGAREGGEQNFAGILDEVRISNVNHSADWISTEYNNQNDTASFLYTGSEESVTASANYEWVELFNAGNTAVNLTGWYLTDNDGHKFNISGAGSIPAGGYLVCHLGEGGTNSSTDVYGYIDYESAITIQPDATAGKDVYLDSTIGILNMGNSVTMTVTNASSIYKRPLVEFDLSGLPSGNIKDAKVWLYRTSGHTTTSATVNLYRVTQSWVEGIGQVNTGANWATYDGTNSWATNGGDFDFTSYGTKTISAGTNAWYDWDVTDLARDWEDGTYSNYGVIIKANDGSEYQDFTSSDNTDSTKHPKLIVNMTTTSPILGNSDDISLVNSNSIVIDYVAWGEDPGSDDTTAAQWSQWTDGEYVDTSDLLENQTIGRDKDSNDTNLPADWENGTGKADPFGIDRSTENGSTPNAQNIDFIIPEFEEIVIPIVFMVLTVTIWRRKKRYKNLPTEPPSQKKRGSSQGCEDSK